MDPMLVTIVRLGLMFTLFAALLAAVGVAAAVKRARKARSTPARFDVGVPRVDAANAATHGASRREAA